MDPRIERTRIAILDACRSMLATTAVTDFSVAGVCAVAGVSRVAFYDRFGSLDGMFEALMGDHLAQIRELAGVLEPQSNPTAATPPADLCTLFATIQANAPLYQAMLGKTGTVSFLHGMREALCEAIQATLHRIPETRDWPIEVATYVDFIAGAVLSVLIGWLRDGATTDPQELARQVWWLIAYRNALSE